MSAALPAYRNLLRAARLAFQGDVTMLTAARSSIREGFRANAALEPSSPEFPAAVKHAEEVATILRQNVVQGRKEGDTYKLQIHEETERGDNDTVKFAGKTLSMGGGKCCSS
ncbi:mitochondrial zinc maintenance protein 1, mitochondrial [Nemania serpens]|nr:mitochondrial zinc maintenance protein 1, mitochondrial [Nemania serpens]